MECPQCQAADQDGYYCVKCGAPLTDDPDNTGDAIVRRHVDAAMGEVVQRSERNKKIIAFLSGALVMLLIALVLFAATDLFGMGREALPSSDKPVVVTNEGAAEDEATKALREMKALDPNASVASDVIVGHWTNYTNGIKIDKVGDNMYRWDGKEGLFKMTFDGTSYVINRDKANYSFTMNGNDRFQLSAAATEGGNAIAEPIFKAGFVAGRVSQDGRSASGMSVNGDAFDIVGKTYGQLAGKFGPGALTVINDDQYILFRGDGGNFAVQFTGNTVPLESDLTHPTWRVVPLTNTTTNPPVAQPVEGNTTGGNQNTTTTDGDKKDNTTNGGNNTTTTTPSTEQKKDQDKTESDKPYKVEIPDMPTFPSTSAVATGVVWADLGFLINNMPTTISLSELSKVMGVSFESGSGGASANGYQFYGSDKGYFAVSYSYGNHSYKISGYGKDTLDRSKTTVFIERQS